MNDQPALDHQASPVKEPSRPVYLEGYDDPTAQVVLQGSDGVALRVHDYYLKASSVFFRELLEAGTKGGPILLEATSLQLRFIMDKVIGKTPKIDTLRDIAMKAPSEAIDWNYHMLWSLIELDRIAGKYLFDNVSICMREIIATYAYSHAPMALAFACQQTPPHGTIARCALKAFEDEMPSWMDGYFRAYEPGYDEDSDSPPTQIYLSPAVPRLTKSFAKHLGAEALLAYVVAMDRESILDEDMEWDPSPHRVKERPKGGKWDWEQVADAFVKEMDIVVHGTVFMKGSDGEIDEYMDGHDLVLESPEV